MRFTVIDSQLKRSLESRDGQQQGKLFHRAARQATWSRLRLAGGADQRDDRSGGRLVIRFQRAGPTSPLRALLMVRVASIRSVRQQRLRHQIAFATMVVVVQ